jgi:tetratricopeptide (TPR) repeat protein/DNA-binding winged helix-turn-helix (wHTH) protein
MASRSITTQGCFRFGDDFELDVSAYELRSRGIPLKLKPIPMELLIFLVERRGELTTREQIVERIWGKGVFLDTDNSINSAISKIRQALRDDPDRARFVLTVPSKGYRFIAPVEATGNSGSAQAALASQTSSANLIGKKISHYRILELLGGGGMGVVYKAEDLKLGRHVAIKFLPGELAHDPKAFQRFEREARAASALDHRNICSIYHLGEYEGQPFIVMQLLEGQTLRDWIGSGPIHRLEQLPELLGLARQIADGLDAAHQRGIIHRDIKPANLFVSTRGEAKILDFGVAQFLADSEAAPDAVPSQQTGEYPHPTHTRTAPSMGTPSYLSPEQIRNERLDARTDLFSFGLVLYEMATGQRAFAGNTAPVIREAVLNLPAVPVRQLNPELPQGLERIINKALEKDRERRYQSARELRSDLERLGPGTSGSTRNRVLVYAAAALLLVVLSMGFVLRHGWRGTPIPTAAPAVRARRSVAVLGFRNLSGDPQAEWISTALAEMLRTELASGDQLRIISGEDIAHMKLDLSLPTTDSYGPETLAKIRQRLNADNIVLGSFLISGQHNRRSLRVDLQLQDAAAGETIAAVSESGNAAEIPDLVSHASARLRDQLGINAASQSEVSQAKTSLPTNPEALRLYSEGLEKLRAFDALAARDLLEQAVTAEPNYSLSHASLAEALFDLGYDAKAGDEAKKAFQLSENLPRADHLFVEGRFRELTRDFPDAIEIYQALRDFFPDDLDYALHLAHVQMRAGHGLDAQQTIARMRSLPEPQNQDARIDIAEAHLGEALGDFHRTQRMAAAAELKAQRQGSRLLLAQAKEREGWAWDELGEYEKAEKVLSEARDLFAASGNPRDSAIVLLDLADVYSDRSQFLAARDSYTEALRLFRQTGAQQKIALTLSSLGSLLYEQGMLEEAKKCQEDALRIDREIGNGTARDSNNLANVLEAMGDLLNALQMRQVAVEGFHQDGDSANEAISATNLGEILLKRGEISSAQQNIDRAMAMQQKIGHKRGLGFSLFVLAEIQRQQDRLQDARSTAEQNVALRRELKDETKIPETQMQLAEIALEQGKSAEAESLARISATAFDQQKVTDLGAQAYADLSQALLAEGKLSEARAASDHAVLLSGKGGDFAAHFDAHLASSAVTAESGNSKEALKVLEAVRSEANRHGYVNYELESRLRMAEIEIKTGNVSAGRSRLERLQADARARGFTLIARKATLPVQQ